MDQGSNKNHSPAYNFVPTVTKFCVMWEGLSLPHDTKFGNCRCKIVDSRAFPNWSLIHGLRWSGLIKAEPGYKLMLGMTLPDETYVICIAVEFGNWFIYKFSNMIGSGHKSNQYHGQNTYSTFAEIFMCMAQCLQNIRKDKGGCNCFWLLSITNVVSIYIYIYIYTVNL